MELNWSLKEIYQGFNSEEFKTDLEKLTNVIEDINIWAVETIKDKDNLVKKLEDYISKFTIITELSNKLNIFINLSLSVNTKDKDALKYSDILEKKLTNLVESSAKLDKYISSIENIENIISQSELLKEHEFIINTVIEQSKYLLSDKEETIVANMKNTGSNAWIKLKDNLISTLKVEIEEDNEIKEVPLTVVLNMAYDKDAKVRKKAYESEIKSYKKSGRRSSSSFKCYKRRSFNNL